MSTPSASLSAFANSDDCLAAAWTAAKARSGPAPPPRNRALRHPERTIEESLKLFLENLPAPQTLSPETERERQNRYWVECRRLWIDSGIVRAVAIDGLYQAEGEFADADFRRAAEGWTPHQRNCMARFFKLLERLQAMLDRPQLMAITGTRGTGKTWAAAALIREFCRNHRPAIYITAKRFFDGLKDTFDTGRTKEYRQRHEVVDLLVIDEVQLRDQDRHWQDAELTELIDARYRRSAATLLLSNFRPEDLQRNLGDSIWRRLIEQGGIYEATWPRIKSLHEQQE